MWQTITNFRDCSATAVNIYSAQLAEELTCFFARFEVTQNTASLPQPVSASNTHTLILQEYEVRRVLRSVNRPRRGTWEGTQGMCGPAFTGLHQHLQSVPDTSHHTTLPEVSHHHTNTQNICFRQSYRPVALAPVMKKCFEKPGLDQIKTSLPLTFDQHQFAYRANMSTEDAIALALHTVFSHYVRMLFIDYSSAFNTIIPDILDSKLVNLGLPTPTCYNRPPLLKRHSY